MKLFIVTPSLGTSPYLFETVASVNRIRDRSGWQVKHIVVVPDEKVAGLREKFTECEFVAEKAKGLYGAINQALFDAESLFDYWTYINDDDCILPGFLEILARAEKTKTPEISYGNVEIIDNRGSVQNRVTRWVWPFGIRGALAGRRSPINQQGALWPAELLGVIGGFDATLKYAADYDYFCRCAKNGVAFHYENSVVASYRIHQHQLGQDGAPFIKELELVRGRYPAGFYLEVISSLLFLLGNWDVYLWRLLRKKPFGTALFRIDEDK